MVKPSTPPSVVVGIDFGMTCTGVAYSARESGWARPEVIQKWPDRKADFFSSKYPTRVGYRSDGRFIDWGTCSLSRELFVVEKEFKLHLDPSFHGSFGDSSSHDEAVKHYQNYMGALHTHIIETLSRKLPRWNERSVEYRFSIPTTWKHPGLTAQLKTWVAQAGFVDTANRQVIFSHTEAEAAAVYAAKGQQLQDGDIIMVVDAGGATTDINLLQVTEQNAGITRVLGLEKAEGINVGSTYIDNEARKIIEQKLRHRHVYCAQGLVWLANTIMDEFGFEYYKCNFGTGGGILNFKMKVPGASEQWVTLKYGETKSIFDGLAEMLINSISTQITSLTRLAPYQGLRYIILSGGLGSSTYIKQRVTAAFCSPHSMHRTENALEVIVAPEPQLAVVKGLVMDRTQTLAQDVGVWAGRCSRASYGILCTYRYDQSRHPGEPTVHDPVTGHLWVEDQIDWIIKEGEKIPEQGIMREYRLRVTNDRQLEPFHAQVVMSELPASDLPNSKCRGGVTKVCRVEGHFESSDFIQGDFVKVKKSIFGNRKKHDIAIFYLKVIVGTTDLEFEFVSLDGRSYSENTTKVHVIWDDVQTSSTNLRE